MRLNRPLPRLLSVILAGALAVPAVSLVSVPLARAAEAAPDPDRVRRRLMWSALALSGVALLGGVYAHARYGENIRRFNEMRVSSADPFAPPDGRCAVNAPGHGGAACASVLDSAERARTAFQISLGVAGAAAATALILKLLEPDAPRQPPAVEGGWALACAPAAGLGGNCILRF